VSFFPQEAHQRVLQDLALHLKGVVSQRLIPDRHGKRVLAVEVLLQTPFISDLMLHGRINEIKDEMAKGNEQGMVTFDQCLFDLYNAGRISAEQAVAHADSVANLSLKMRLAVHHSTADAPTGLAMNDLPLKNF
jgi:twitching motility protein PilU